MDLGRRAILSCVIAASFALEAQDVDLPTLENGFQILGTGSNLRNYSISGAGDFNGDGLADLIVGAPQTPPAALCDRYIPPEAYVIYGKADNATVRLDELNGIGVRLRYTEYLDFAGSSVSGIGDFNGDGLSDVILGAEQTGGGTGAAYIVLGSRQHEDVLSLTEGSSRVIDITGFAEGDQGGYSVSGAGDVNGDGLADVIIGVPGTDYGAEPEAGEALIVLGNTAPTSIDVSNLAEHGYRIRGTVGGMGMGHAVSGAGDVNGDGYTDLIVSPGITDPANVSYLVFGKPDTVSVLLGTSNSKAVALSGGRSHGRGAGDVNGDGLADLVLGRPDQGVGGESYVVLGKRNFDAFDFDDPGTDKSVLASTMPDDLLGAAVAGIGDHNGDGLAEVLAGAPEVDRELDFDGVPFIRYEAGEAYVVYGSQEPQTLEATELGEAGFRIKSEAYLSVMSLLGSTVRSAGDVNGDGLADLAVGAEYRNDDFTSYCYGATRGKGYVIFSSPPAAGQAVYRTNILAGDAPPTPVGIIGDGSNAATPDSQLWIDFEDGNGNKHQTSTVEVTMIRGSESQGSSELAIDRRWGVSSDREQWSRATLSIRYLEAELSVDNEFALQLYYAADATKPAEPLISTVDTRRNLVTAVIDQLGFFYLGLGPDDVFSSGFEVLDDD